MFRTIMPIVIIAISITGFFLLVVPLYKDVSTLKAEVSAYNEALDNSKKLEKERDKLTAKYNSLTPQNIDRLNKLLPDSVDNIRLILEIEKIASPYGMVLKDIKYDSSEKQTNSGAVSGGTPIKANTSFGTWDLEFSTEGSYHNFINFMKDLENNLRIVDISSIQFSSEAPNSSKFSPDTYKYVFKIKTYWLKN